MRDDVRRSLPAANTCVADRGVRVCVLVHSRPVLLIIWRLLRAGRLLGLQLTKQL